MLISILKFFFPAIFLHIIDKFRYLNQSVLPAISRAAFTAPEKDFYSRFFTFANTALAILFQPVISSGNTLSRLTIALF